jgi:dTDP-4-dehydrorhamnose reductase
VRALITGAGGQLARELVRAVPAGVEPKAVSRSECDITDPQAVDRVLTSFRPDVVINAAAYTAVDAAEEARDVAFRVNAQGAEHVARSAERAGARLVHISTDYVFDGDRSTPYPPDASPNPLNVYGQSKLEAERLVMSAAPSALVIRTGWLYSGSGKNFLTSILAALNGPRPLRVVNDQIGSPTSAPEFAAAIWKTLQSEISGVYHWSNLGAASWYDFAVEIARLVQQLEIRSAVPTIVAVTSDEYGSRARRPRYSVLDSTLLARTLQTSPSHWQQGILAALMRGSGEP